jgi:hypothetical protein
MTPTGQSRQNSSKTSTSTSKTISTSNTVKIPTAAEPEILFKRCDDYIF